MQSKTLAGLAGAAIVGILIGVVTCKQWSATSEVITTSETESSEVAAAGGDQCPVQERGTWSGTVTLARGSGETEEAAREDLKTKESGRTPSQVCADAMYPSADDFTYGCDHTVCTRVQALEASYNIQDEPWIECNQGADGLFYCYKKATAECLYIRTCGRSVGVFTGEYIIPPPSEPYKSVFTGGVIIK